MRNKISDKSRLVKFHLERECCENYKKAFGKKENGRGIYVLYRKNKIYYIGLSKSSLRGRLRRHFLRDYHKGKWNKFSFYQIGRKKYIKDVESLLLRIINPSGNKISGKFKSNYNLNKKDFREIQ